MKVTIEVNGRTTAEEVEDRTLLVHYLRETVGLTATNIGCDTTSCGACTVLLDGESVKSCTVLAAQADGHAVTTMEGLAGATAPSGVCASASGTRKVEPCPVSRPGQKPTGDTAARMTAARLASETCIRPRNSSLVRV